MNSPVNTFEEIARKQDVVLQGKAEKLCNGLIRRYIYIIQQNGMFTGKY